MTTAPTTAQYVVADDTLRNAIAHVLARATSASGDLADAFEDAADMLVSARVALAAIYDRHRTPCGPWPSPIGPWLDKVRASADAEVQAATRRFYGRVFS